MTICGQSDVSNNLLLLLLPQSKNEEALSVMERPKTAIENVIWQLKRVKRQQKEAKGRGSGVKGQ